MFRLLRTREGDGKRDRELGKCFKSIITKSRDFPGGIVDKNSPARDMGSIPGPGRFHMSWSN